MNQIFEQLAAESSRKAKESIVANNKNSPLFTRVLELALSPYIQFYIKKIPDYTPNRGDSVTLTLSEALDVLDRISKRKATGNFAIFLLTEILEKVSVSDAQVIERIIQKDLKCGVAASTVNKAYGSNLIPEYPIMLCSPLDDSLDKHIKFPAIAQLKMDGMRFNAIVENGSVEFRSRNGKLIDLHGELEMYFLDIVPSQKKFVFDGELLVYRDGKPVSRQEGNGILNKAVKNTISPEEANTVHATLWDVIDGEAWLGHSKSEPYAKRLQLLNSSISKLPENAKLHLVNTHEVQDMEEAKALYLIYREHKEEGIIIKSPLGLWEDKRVKHQVKLKAENPADLRCVGWVEGTGKYAGMLGALQLETEDGIVSVNVGTGFTDENRKTITEQDVVGKIIEITYNEQIKDKRTLKKSLFLPVFVQIREDKNTANTSDEL